MHRRKQGQPTGFALQGQEIVPTDVRTFGVEWQGPVVCELPEGFKVRELSFPYDYEWEGAFMGHCLGVVRDHYRAFSCWHLEDKEGVPHVTIVAYPGGERIYEIRGRGNAGPRADYRVMVQTFLEQAGIQGDDHEAPRWAEKPEGLDSDSDYHERYLTSYIVTGLEGVYG